MLTTGVIKNLVSEINTTTRMKRLELILITPVQISLECKSLMPHLFFDKVIKYANKSCISFMVNSGHSLF